MTWHKISLTDEQISRGVEMKIQQQFHALFLSAGAPQKMALFSTRVNPDGLDLFFSPDSLPLARGLIDSYSGSPCEKPDREKVVLLSGLADAPDLLLER